MDLLIITNENSDIIYKHVFNKTNEKETSKLILLAYGSIDIIENLMSKTKDNYLDCIDSYINYNVSVLVFPSAYKAILVHANKRGVKKFLTSVHEVFKKFILYEVIRDDYIYDPIIHEEIAKLHKELIM